MWALNGYSSLIAHLGSAEWVQVSKCWSWLYMKPELNFYCLLNFQELNEFVNAQPKKWAHTRWNSIVVLKQNINVNEPAHFVLKSIMNFTCFSTSCSNARNPKFCIVLKSVLISPSLLHIDQNWHLELIGECWQCFTTRPTSQSASEDQQKSAHENKSFKEEVVISRKLRKMTHSM